MQTEATISPAQLIANQTNAQLSTGPRTEAGKNRSRINAVRHGLSGRTVVLPTEDLAAYKKFSIEIVDSLRPETPLERQFAQTIADSQWRLNRVRSIEDGILAVAHFEEAGNIDVDNPEIHTALTAARAFREQSHAFVNLSIYEQRIHRVLERTMKQLEDLQEKRRTQFEKEMDRAVQFHKQHEMTGRRWNPVDDGFVYSRAQVESESTRRTRSQNARIADIHNYNLEECEARGAA